MMNWRSIFVCAGFLYPPYSYTTGQIYKVLEQGSIMLQTSSNLHLDLAYILTSSELLCDHDIDAG